MRVTAASPLLCSHPTSCCSVAEIMSVLFFHTMKYRYDDPRNFNNDRFILSKVTITQSCWSNLPVISILLVVSKRSSEFGFLEILVYNTDLLMFSLFLQGHAAPALYSMWVEAGFLKESELLSLCHVDSTLEGHPTPVSYHMYSHTGHHLMQHNRCTECCGNTLCVLRAFQKQQFVDIATGSLGQGLGVACGMAYTGKYFDKSR